MLRFRPQRRTSALRTQRALLIVAVLQGGNYSARDLIERIERLRPGLLPTDPVDALQKDIRFARHSLGCDIRYLRKTDTYTLIDPGIVATLVPIRAEDLSAIAAIRSTFTRSLPLAGEVNRFLDRINPDPQITSPLSVLLLSDGHWEKVQATVHEIDLARQLKQRLEFAYRSLKSNRPKRHVVEVHTSLEFRDGHLYLDAYSLDSAEFRTYRVDRIIPDSLTILPTRIASRERRWIRIRYRLAQEAARDGSTPHFRNHTERQLPNGWVEVTAEASSVFFAAQVLLHYGDSCVVEEPESLVMRMREMAGAMLARYEPSKANRTSRR